MDPAANSVLAAVLNPLAHLDRVPADFRERGLRWYRAEERFFRNDLPLINLSIRKLMYAEPALLSMERELSGTTPQDRFLLEQCSALSMYWAFGLFEVTRQLSNAMPKAKASHSHLETAVADFHTKLSALRMPLAKHKVMGQVLGHYPTSVQDSGRVGWSTFNPKSGKMESLFRTELADEFLKIAALPQ